MGIPNPTIVESTNNLLLKTGVAKKASPFGPPFSYGTHALLSRSV